MKTLNTAPDEKQITAVMLCLVCAAALTISTWSLMTLGLSYHIPYPVAATFSAAFDMGAIFSSYIALLWARSTRGGGSFTRAAALLFMGSSAWLNYEHGRLIHAPLPVCYMLSLSSVVSIVSLEAYLRYSKRRAIKNGLPRFERIAWVLFPRETYQALRSLVKARLDRVTATGNAGSAVTIRTEQREQETRGGVSARTVRQWALHQGMTVSLNGRVPDEIWEQFLTSQNGHHAEVTS